MLTKYPFNPNHEKNNRYLSAPHDDPEGQKYHWFQIAYPNHTEGDFFCYIDSTNCTICATKYTKECQRTMYGNDPVCENCKNILENVIDLEHLLQLKEYMKERNTNGKIQNSQLPTDNRGVPRCDKTPSGRTKRRERTEEMDE